MPDDGTIEIDGQPADLSSARRSRAAGIAVVQQELSLVPTLTAGENVFLGGRFGGLGRAGGWSSGRGPTWPRWGSAT